VIEVRGTLPPELTAKDQMQLAAKVIWWDTVVARDSIYAIARICYRPSVCPSVCPSHG